MVRRAQPKFDIYRLLCPISAVTIIGAGMVILATGDMLCGGSFIFSGIIVGSMAPVAPKNIHRQAKLKHRD